MEGKTKEVVEVVYDKVACESWCVTKKDGVCVNPAITCRHKLIYIRTLTLEVKAEQGATAPYISPWPTKLLMFGEDMQSDQLHVPANRTVDFCSSMTLFALRKNFTFHTVSSIACTSSF